ncbi:GNAT family N-acetyltransferase [Streptomyces sp. OUCMDZ-4982]|uniref:GNAT family N-acetyltransferase n=1 Tax=Streptomyces sp. OUCMDZ-4982 TaxID=2973090 RepID=UPI00215BC15B|nr:GNAT family N-acetyltransferase [Streptomyces sp. OUCMDZ-4982]MCR8946023.1 GNAT family N-acetyltransferase [Streptomyces sp. OUCMDZ-4982]
MQIQVRPFDARDLAPVIDLSLRAWAPVYESFAEVMGPEIFGRQYPDWRTSQRREVEAACTEGKAHVWVAGDGARVVGFVAVVLEPDGGAGAVELPAVDPECQGRGDTGLHLDRRRPGPRARPENVREGRIHGVAPGPLLQGPVGGTVTTTGSH